MKQMNHNISIVQYSPTPFIPAFTATQLKAFFCHQFIHSIRHAGSVFLGRYCPESLGDYLAGPNHTLPTQGTAKFSSPLSVDDFVKKTQYTYFTRDALARVAEDVDLFARKEGLTAHARSATIRTRE